MKYILFYDYVENMLERRAPVRAGHLALASEWHANGRILMAGAFTEPLDGAAFVFEAESPAEIERFVAEDPYVNSGLVTAWRIRPWNVVIPAQA